VPKPALRRSFERAENGNRRLCSTGPGVSVLTLLALVGRDAGGLGGSITEYGGPKRFKRAGDEVAQRLRTMAEPVRRIPPVRGGRRVEGTGIYAVGTVTTRGPTRCLCEALGVGGG